MTSLTAPRSGRAPCALAVAILLWSWSLASGETTSAAPSDLWHAPAFSASAADLLAAASSVPAGDAGALILLNEHRYTFDSKGRLTLTDRLIYRVLDSSAVDDWSSMETDWAPWNEETPTVRARVVTPDASEHLLDPKTIAEEGSSEGSFLLYGDRHRLRAPLPSVTAGCVVEREVTTKEKEPLFDAGRVSVFVLDRTVPVQLSRVSVEAPRGLDLATVVHVTPPVPASKEELEDRVRLTWEAGRREPKTSWEPDAPSDSPQSSYIAFATGRSWSRVAQRYAEIVDDQIGKVQLRTAISEATGGATQDRAATIARLLASIQKRIRYTGVEFSEASIVPRPPAETLKRGYGDCKDKATLLVATLRQAGVPAFVALLRTGPGPDVEKTLYGLGSFDHAIVYIPGPPEVWIDPTESMARAGELPGPSQDRLALIAARETTDLIRTPAAVPSDNLRREVRDFFLAERGNSRVVETTETTGLAEISYRHSYADTTQKQAQKNAESYAGDEYLAKGGVKYSHSSPTDLTKPFTLRIEAEDAGRGVSSTDQALVAILPSTVVRSFPSAFHTSPDDSELLANRRPGSLPKKRTLDYVFFEPFVAEWRYRIHPPIGFRSAALPESKEEHLGVATFSRSFSVGPDGTVEARIRVDVGKRRLTVEEFESTREAVSKLARSQATLVRFEQVGHAYLASGQIKEALAEFRRLAALHPGEALHDSQIALALLQGGLGEAAREEARRATTLEPKSALAWRTLGWVLQHDVLGRRFRAGFPRNESIAAYRKSLELDASDVVTRADLAILLEHDAEGTRYGHGADLAGAIDEYRSIRKDLKNHAFDINLCLALMRAERFAELAETAREIDASPTRDQLLVLAAAATGGTQAGLSEARLIPETDKRRDDLEAVGRTLLQLRRYPEAAEFLAASVTGSPKAAALRALADLVGKTKRHEQVALDETDPKSVLPKLIAAIFVKERPDPAELAPLVASSVAKEELDPEKTSLSAIGGLRRLLPQVDGPLDFVVDLMLPALRQDLEGDDESGYRIHMAGAAGAGSINDTFFLVREGGHPRFLASLSNVTPLGREALARLEADRLVAARRLLDWAREALPAGSSDDPLGGPVFSALWTKGKEADADRTRLAAAALAIGSPDAKREIEILTAARSSLQTDADRDACDRALAAGYIRAKDYAKALPLADHLAQAHPDSATGFRLRVLVLTRLKRLADVQAAAKERLARLPDDPDALRTLFHASSMTGEYSAVETWGRRLTSLPSAEADDYNSLAWNSLFLEGANEHAIEDSRRAVDMSKENNAASLHTLATLYAETGKATEARELILKSLDVAGRDLPLDHDWYVFGRIAEGYGETAAAVAAYSKVKRPTDDLALPMSTFLLASRRLKVLGADRPRKRDRESPTSKVSSRAKTPAP